MTRLFSRAARLHTSVFLVVLFLVGLGRLAAQFPPITDAEKSLTVVPEEPRAPAVVLSRKGKFHMEPLGKFSQESRFTVQVRLKILTEEGLEYGEIALPHSSYRRLKKLKGRTVLPDGRVAELAKQDVFKQQASRRDRTFVTVAALPALEVGAILDYEYELWYGSFYTFLPWYFQDRVPTLYSEISYVVPLYIGVRRWGKAPPDRMNLEIEPTRSGRVIKAWMENLPAIPDEPYAFPFGDLAAQFLVLPVEYFASGIRTQLLANWEDVCDLLDSSYKEHRNKSRQARRRARELATATGPDTRHQVAALYRFVRDEVELEALPGVFLRDGASVDSVLAQGRGDPADKALVLQAMLHALKIESSLVWVAERSGGRVDLTTPNPGWFDGMIVRVSIDGEETFLDPSDRRLGFGRLSPELEGTEALVLSRKKPHTVTLPQTTFADNVRRAHIDLALDEEGRLSGHGGLELGGHHAWRQMRSQLDAGDKERVWQSWVEASFADYAVDGVEVKERIDEARIDVSWSMQQREEEVLGDESSLIPARPLGPVKQPFTVPQSRRRTPMLMPFGNRNQVEMTLRWPEGWQLEVVPKTWSHSGSAGEIKSAVEVNAAERVLRYSRHFDITAREAIGGQSYQAIRTLFAEVERNDAQDLVLVRR